MIRIHFAQCCMHYHYAFMSCAMIKYNLVYIVLGFFAGGPNILYTIMIFLTIAKRIVKAAIGKKSSLNRIVRAQMS